MAMTQRTLALFGGALLLRLVLIAYGAVQDAYMTVKYTDVDYDVYTDAAREMAAGNSPFDRTTYRYTPVLAFLLLPNIYLHEVFGKLLFVACDLVTGRILYQILRLRDLPDQSKTSLSCNADSIVVLLVLLSLLLIMRKQLVLSALAYGAAVHFKIYPIVYALAFLVVRGHSIVPGRRCSSNAYGFQFLYEAYLYHFTRTDNRHNLSVYFYDLYLRYNTPSGFEVGLLAFLPQLTSLVAISLAYGRDLSFALFALTMVFVIFNKVCTAQLHWLYWAYHLEMQGANTFFPLWLAGLLFFSVNVGILATLMQHHSYTPLFRNGSVLQLMPNDRAKLQ
ncbi:hypothetical protein BBJ28_00019196 [Nothophytophthora sp. Chile5]|nr:hypothetical protein BBJ28_00019196 [Nothophytophthora sp. Chile5]